ncbi:MAG: permease [Thermoleophilia bacterium]
MFWEILWALILGFAISAVIQAVVSRRELARLLPDDSPRSLATATVMGAASSSCSYAAVAIARSLFRKGGDFTAAIVFEFASTNLVVELGIIMAILLGWQFTLAEFIGGPVMIVALALFFRIFLKRRLVEAARAQANRGRAGLMEGHAQMDMSVRGGSLLRRIFSQKGMTSTSHYFYMDWASVWRDIALGLLIAGALAAWVPESFWQSLFLGGGLAARVWGPLIGPAVSLISFVCSIGNVPLAVVLWNGGISFGGVISFIFADLIILPILNIYRKYYGMRMSLFLLVGSYVSMVIAGFVIEALFGVLGLIPEKRGLSTVFAGISPNYTTVLNAAFLALALAMLVRFLRTGGIGMLKMMNQPETQPEVPAQEHRA